MGTKIILVTFMVMLSEVTESFLPNLGEKLTLIAALAYFLYYFMKELKSVREQQNKDRIDHEDKMEKMFDRVVQVEKASNEALLRTNQSNERLAQALEELSEKLNHFKI